MVLASGALGVFDAVSRGDTLGAAGLYLRAGLGAVMNDPAWQAITPELVPPEQTPRSRGDEFHRIQRGARAGTRVGRNGDCGSGIGSAFLLMPCPSSG